MSTQNFPLPDVGEGLTEAEIVSWKVAPGDTVAINDVIVEIETAKSLVELPSPYAGVVESVLVASGETVDVGTPIIRFGEAGAAGSDGEGASAGAGTAPTAEALFLLERASFLLRYAEQVKQDLIARQRDQRQGHQECGGFEFH